MELWKSRRYRAGSVEAHICHATCVPLTRENLQCVKEGWSVKLKEQSNEGCNIAGRLRVNKVIGNIHLSPGRSFQTSTSQNIYELVPYLRDDGNRHDFSHLIHHFAFEGDDEYDASKYEAASYMRKRMSIDYNPLDGAEGRVKIPVSSNSH
jgi:endoplasmic reticulum-Golgi intermediate compartment protein 3